MSNFEAGLTRDQADLLMGSMGYLSNADNVEERVSQGGVVHQHVETESGVDIRWYQTTVDDAKATGIFFGRLELQLDEEEGSTDVLTQIKFYVNDEGVVCTAKEELRPEAGGNTDRTIKRSNLDETVRKMSKLLNQVYY